MSAPQLYWADAVALVSRLGSEVWKEHPHYPFVVSTRGRVASLRTGRVLAGFLAGGASSGPSTGRRWRPNRYRRVNAGPGFDVQNPAVHTLVLETFVGPRPDGHDADHIDGDRLNNRLENLRWLPAEENRGRASRKRALA